ncbi:hypothetical protein BpHYR1_009683 [Brachionus plicatilis]|uniref:Uncharacterized protein n=1 Tax=Brachionus plicatilis TaxID=10195 RepID=A0A3M7RJE1_BRAPC|nr:hypothetical protein BpHYR1_009683 [Brachionus plicatilis]
MLFKITSIFMCERADRVTRKSSSIQKFNIYLRHFSALTTVTKRIWNLLIVFAEAGLQHRFAQSPQRRLSLFSKSDKFKLKEAIIN